MFNSPPNPVEESVPPSSAKPPQQPQKIQPPEKAAEDMGRLSSIGNRFSSSFGPSRASDAAPPSVDSSASRWSASSMTERIAALQQNKYARIEAKLMTNGPRYTVLMTFVMANVVLFWYGVILEAREWSNFRRYTTVIARGTG
jgi:hypothetical protein